MLIWWLITALSTDDLEQGADWRFDVNRINELRSVDTSYRLFHPVINMFARINRTTFRDALPSIQKDITRAGISKFWLAEEYLGRAQLIALFLMPLYLFISLQIIKMPVPSIILSIVAVIATVWLLRRRLASHAAFRIMMLKRRLPFLLDLLTLLMGAGANFLGALQQAVSEFEGQAVGQEFGRVITDMNLGKSRTDAFLAMDQRLEDDEISGIIHSIVQGEDLGTPLVQVFSTQADVLRLKRTQRAETVAGEAGVNMLLPGMMVMVSTVLIILGPFIILFFSSGGF